MSTLLPPSLKGKADPLVERYLRDVQQAVALLQGGQVSVQAAITQVVASTPTTADVSKSLRSSGSAPLNVSNLPGVLAQPQNAAVPVLTALPTPPSPLCQKGTLVIYGSKLYFFNAATSPGTWVDVSTLTAPVSSVLGTSGQVVATPVGSVITLALDASVAKISPAWTTYAPTLTLSAGTATITVTNCRWWQSGKIVYVRGHLTFTVSAPATYGTISLPAPALDNDQTLAVSLFVAAAGVVCPVQFSTGARAYATLATITTYDLYFEGAYESS